MQNKRDMNSGRVSGQPVRGSRVLRTPESYLFAAIEALEHRMMLSATPVPPLIKASPPAKVPHISLRHAPKRKPLVKTVTVTGRASPIGVSSLIPAIGPSLSGATVPPPRAKTPAQTPSK